MYTTSKNADTTVLPGIDSTSDVAQMKQFPELYIIVKSKKNSFIIM